MSQSRQCRIFVSFSLKENRLVDIVEGVGLALDPLPIHEHGTFYWNDAAARASDLVSLGVDRDVAMSGLNRTLPVRRDVNTSHKSQSQRAQHGESHRTFHKV